MGGRSVKGRPADSARRSSADRRDDLRGAPGGAGRADPAGRRALALRDVAGAHLPARPRSRRRPAGVMPPMAEDAIEPLLDRFDGVCLSGGRTWTRGPTAPRPTPTWADRARARPDRAVARTPGGRSPDADPRDLQGHPGAERLTGRHPAPAPARPQHRHRPPPEGPRGPGQPPCADRARQQAREHPRHHRAGGQHLPPPGDRPARRRSRGHRARPGRDDRGRRGPALARSCSASSGTRRPWSTAPTRSRSSAASSTPAGGPATARDPTRASARAAAGRTG